MSVLNVTVSRFASYLATDPQPVNLLEWLQSDEHAGAVAELRTLEDKKRRDAIKKTLPAITPSGTFTRREKSALVDHSGLICLDIDEKGNEHITNYTDLKDQLRQLVNVAYCGLSASGRGYFLLIPIPPCDAATHERHFRALEADFLSFGLRIDQACKDVSRLRGASYDPEAYFNHRAVTYTKLWTPPKPARRRRVSAEVGNAWKVERIIDQVNAGRIDLTPTYPDWFAIGCALANEYGEAGRGYFHEISQYHPKYDQTEADKQFDHCIGRRNGGGYTIATLFDIAAQYGIRYKDHATSN